MYGCLVLSGFILFCCVVFFNAYNCLNLQVVIRIRPPLERELAGEVPFKNIVNVHANEQTVTISDHLEAIIDEQGEILANTGPYNGHSFVFDHVYDQNSSQKKVFDTTARTVVDSALTGYNATIFACKLYCLL